VATAGQFVGAHSVGNWRHCVATTGQTVNWQFVGALLPQKVG
jgi:hypothetical protein